MHKLVETFNKKKISGTSSEYCMYMVCATATSTLCVNVTFEPSKAISLQSTQMNLIESIRAVALGIVSLKLIENESKRSINMRY